MKFRYPKYYEKFKCVADKCEDTCCAGWEIDIDDASYEYYMGVPGELGKRLRESIKEYKSDEESAYEQHGFRLKKGRRCPFLDDNNLCDLYRELGEDALCDVCADTPRNYLEYGGARELSLSVSCAEAGRLLYGEKEPIVMVEKEIEGALDVEESEEELLFAEQIREARDCAVRILQNRELSVLTRAVNFLRYAEQVQKCFNEGAAEEVSHINTMPFFNGSTIVDNKENSTVRYRCFLQRLRSFTALESISEEWEVMMNRLYGRYAEGEDGGANYERDSKKLWQDIQKQEREYEYEHLLVYYSFLCLARCVDDYDFLAKAKLVITSFLMIRDMDGICLAEEGGHYKKAHRIQTSRIYAKEVEHSSENMEYLADEFLFEEAYTVENLCLALTI